VGATHTWQLSLPKKSVIVPGDQARLHQVVTNLLANARIHTPVKSRVTVSLTLDSKAERAIVEVADNGPGIDPAVLDSVFERFVRGDGSRSRAAGSTGLGLAIVSGIVEAHGGSTEVTSTAGATVFRVLLPTVAADSGRLGE
jgi:two-component system, OmpR family, sensor kinase